MTNCSVCVASSKPKNKVDDITDDVRINNRSEIMRMLTEYFSKTWKAGRASKAFADPKKVAAAFCGNIMQESRYDPSATNGIGAYGICQWLGERNKGLQMVHKYNLLESQVNFIIYELENEEKNTLKKLREDTDATLKRYTYIVRRFYERPGESEAYDDKRFLYAQYAYNG